MFWNLNFLTSRLAAENLVDILIKTEEEIKVDNYKDVEVPEDVIPTLDKMDEPYLQGWNLRKYTIFCGYMQNLK